MRRRLQKGSKVCVILDRALADDRRILAVARQAISGGAGLIQLRDKRNGSTDILDVAIPLKKIADRYKILFIVNDRLDVAAAIKADGLHIGQGDIGISVARKILGKHALIGVSVRTMAQALAAMKAGADYVGAGPAFKTPVKRGIKPLGKKLYRDLIGSGISFFAIGGIDHKNVYRLKKIGVTNVAVIRSVLMAKDPRASVARIIKALS